MIHRIDRCFKTARDHHRKVLIPFITAGDPEPEWTVQLMHQLVAGGADLIELGIPFSDPMADGPVIQASSERAVKKGVDLRRVLDWVGEFRQADQETPVVLMGYMNSFERFGYSNLGLAASSAGVDGVLLVDCPPEEMKELQGSLDENGIYPVRLVAPTTSGERLALIAGSARGFIYYVSFKGITGAGQLDTAALSGPLSQIRNCTQLPVAVGFGIKDARSASQVAQFADGVVVGSALVEQLAACEDAQSAFDSAKGFVASIRQALDNSAA